MEDIDGTTVTLTQELKDSLEGTGSSIANIMVGETMSIYEALNCLMVQSGNDAAVILADYVGGRKNQETGNPEKLSNIDRFVQMMNDKAASSAVPAPTSPTRMDFMTKNTIPPPVIWESWRNTLWICPDLWTL